MAAQKLDARDDSGRGRAKTPAIYDRYDRAHQDWLLDQLDRMRVPFWQLDEIGNRLHGKRAGELGVIASEVRGRLARDLSENGPGLPSERAWASGHPYGRGLVS